MTRRLRNRGQKGFTLIELLIVVAIIGIIAAIAIPNLLSAVQRGKQKRTMGDMRTLGSAIMAYNIDNSQYPLQPALGNISGVEQYLQPFSGGVLTFCVLPLYPFRPTSVPCLRVQIPQSLYGFSAHNYCLQHMLVENFE